MSRIAIIEDDEGLASFVATILEGDGNTAAVFPDGETTCRMLAGDGADLVILDLGLPGMSGAEVLRWLRNQPRLEDVPVIAMTGSQDIRDRYKMIAEGVDDFLTKPFDSFELVLRVRNRLRRRRSRQENVPRRLAAGDLEVDLDVAEVRVGGRTERLTRSELAIIKTLAARLDRPVDTETLLTEALEYPPRLGNPDIVRTHIRHLREKIETDPAAPCRIVNLPRMGYVLRSRAGIPDEGRGSAGTT